MLIAPRSSVRGLVWPALPRGEAATFLALAFQLEASQWSSPQDLWDRQAAQLSSLVRHAFDTVPFYRARLEQAGIGDGPSTLEAWRRIPLLTREDIRRHGADLESRALPPGHGDTFARKTSGSTGEPLVVLGSEVTGLFWQLLSFRDDLWHRHNPGERLVAIRSGRYAEDPLAVHDLPCRGFYPSAVCPTGPMTVFYHTTPIPRQAAILEARSPRYLLTYPSNARALCRHARRKPLRLPDLEAVLTYGEPLPPDVRAACRETWGVPVHDVYGCEEVGYLALQCPLHDHYHVQSESVLVEVLDDAGRPVAPGELGWVVVTPLVNFAMPLLRYRIGDLAEAGARCPCGRGLPVLARVPGRARGQVLRPDGTHAFPDQGAIWDAIEDVDQIQVVQTGPLDVEVRYCRAHPVGPAEERAIVARVQEALGHPFPLTLRRLPVLRRQPNGKYETFTGLCPR
jgi:phenylacetate-CoA ligase